MGDGRRATGPVEKVLLSYHLHGSSPQDMVSGWGYRTGYNCVCMIVARCSPMGFGVQGRFVPHRTPSGARLASPENEIRGSSGQESQGK